MKAVAEPNWVASYVYRLAALTGWSFHDILRMPFSAGLQILDADSFMRNIPRVYEHQSDSAHFDSLAAIDAAFAKLL